MFIAYNCCHILNIDIVKIKRETIYCKVNLDPCHVVELLMEKKRIHQYVRLTVTITFIYSKQSTDGIHQ